MTQNIHLQKVISVNAQIGMFSAKATRYLVRMSIVQDVPVALNMNVVLAIALSLVPVNVATVLAPQLVVDRKQDQEKCLGRLLRFN